MNIFSVFSSIRDLRRDVNAMKDISLVVLPNGAVLAFINLVDVKTVVEISLLLVSIAYTIWRWWRDAHKK